MNRDIKNNMATCLMYVPTDFTATVGTNAVDTQNFEAIKFDVIVGALGGISGSNTLTITLEESDDLVGANFATVSASEVIGAFTLIDDASEDAVVQSVGYIGSKRYLRIKLTEAGTITGGYICVVANLSHARNEVASNVDADATT